MMLLMAFMISATTTLAVNNDKPLAPPSADVNVTLLSTPPANGFKPGDMIDIMITVTNVDNSAGAFRVDLLDYPSIPVKVADYIEYNQLRFGNNVILREASFSHGVFLRTNVDNQYQCNNCDEKIAAEPELDREFATRSNAYTWIIDQRFRNGSLGMNDVASLHLTIEFIADTFNFQKIADEGPQQYQLFVDYTEPLGYYYDTETLLVPIDLQDFESPEGVRTYTTVIAPMGLQAGEPFMIELGMLNYGNSILASYDLRINHGMTSFYSNFFYMNHFSNGVPNHPYGGALSFSSLSFRLDEMELFNNYNEPPKSSESVNGPSSSRFKMAYLPYQDEYSVISVDYCDYFSSEDSCYLEPIYLFSSSVSRLFIQGVSTLEMAGSNALLTGDVSVEEATCGSEVVNALDCKAVSGTAAQSGEVFQINEQVPIAPYTFTKTVSDPCFESGESGYFKLELTGADFRKTSSIWLVSDKVPTAVSPTDISYNFNKSFPNNNGREYGVISKEPGGGFQYAFSNASYMWILYQLSQPKEVENTQTQYTFDFGWYDSIHFTLPFDVEDDAVPGVHTNTAIFNYFSYPFDRVGYENVTKSVSHVMVPSYSNFEEVDAETLLEFWNLNYEYYVLPGKFSEQTADFAVGCSVVSGYKFHDLNANGVRDSGEPGLEGWEVTIQGSEGTYTATTDANGFYEFPNVLIGNYQVRETQQAGWVQSAPGGEGFYNVSLPNKGSSATADFGNYRQAQVFGYKYIDRDGSGSRDQGEPAMEGVRVQLRGLSGNVVAEVLTDANGYYEFAGIVPGHYAVYEVIPEGMYQSQPGPAEGGFYYLVLSSGEQVGPKNFGNYYLTIIEGIVYYDGAAPPKGVTGGEIMTDRFAAPGIPVSGVRTGPAPLKPAPGSTDVLLPGASTFTAVTDEDGYFKVDGLLPGLYTLTVQPPAFTTVITQNPLTEILVSGGFVEIEFGLFYDAYAAPEVLKSSITGSVFADANGDGAWQFPSEPGVSGRSVSLSGTSKRGTDITRTTSTGPDGSYTFAELPEGRYVVTVQSAAGASIGSPLSSSHVVVLGANQSIGLAGSGAPGGAGWLQSALAGEDQTFGSLVLAIDTDMNGVADTRLDLSGLAKFKLGGITGQTARPFALTSMQMYGDNAQGAPIVAVTPGLIEALGELAGSGAQVSRDMESGLVISAGGDFYYTSDAIPFVGTADRWPIRNTSAVFNATVTGEPVALRDVQGNVVAHILYAEHTPLFGVDFAAERADFGDAPATYGTLRATPSDAFVLTASGIVYPLDGARHLMPWTGMPSLTLGESATADANGQPGADANGDFDNGVVLPAAVAPNSAFTATVNVTGTGLLSVWVDQNRNGVFEPSEKLVSDRSVATGAHALTLNSGTAAGSGVTFVRVRLTTQAGVGPTGLAADGEVEDYMLAIDATLAGGGGGLPTSDDGDSAIPTSFALHQNYPNPFNPTTVIPYDLASPGNVRLTVYDVTGRPVAQLLNAQQNAGRHQVAFNAAGLPSGVYMVRLEAGGQVMVRKLTLLK
jgi:hypothetical protein